MEMLISPGRLCQASLRKYKHFLEVPSICFCPPPTPVPSGRIALAISKLVIEGCQCSCQCSVPVSPAQGLCVGPLSLRGKRVYSSNAHRKAWGAGVGSAPRFSQIQFLPKVTLHSLASEQCNVSSAESFCCSAVVDR